MTTKTLDLIYSGQSLDEVDNETGLSPDHLMMEWRAWRERQRWGVS